MKTISFCEIENRKIITGIQDTAVDPAETEKKVDAIIAASPNILLTETRQRLLNNNIVFSHPGPGQFNVEDVIGTTLMSAFQNLNSHEKLLISGEKIDDLRGIEFWIQDAGRWSKQKIENLGETLPSNGILPDNLSPSQQKEIAEQTEADRLTNLTPEQKTEEKEIAVNAAKKEALRLKEEAEIADEDFNAKAWFQAKKAEIEQKYE